MMSQNQLLASSVAERRSEISKALAEGIDLKTILLGRQVETPESLDRYFIPADLIQAVDEEIIETELKKGNLAKDRKQCRNYAEMICKFRKRVFVLLVCFGDPTNWENFMQRLVTDELNDTDLPLCRGHYGEKGKNQLYVLCKREHASRCRRPEHRECGVQLLRQWGRFQIQSLHRDQWSVQAPVFSRGENGEIPHFDLPDHIIMPFTEDNEKKVGTERGGYGEVWSVRIHSAHQNVIAPRGSQEPLLAVKRLYKAIDFELENRFLRALTEQEHPHLMSLLATYRFELRYHFLFPYAKANLRKYWNSEERLPWTRRDLLWFLRQLKGLVSALAAIHVYKPKRPNGAQTVPVDLDRYTSSRTPRPAKMKQDIPTDETYGRHGDIKPENILLVDIDDGSPGILQIADFGLSRFHRIESRSIQDPSRINGSATYSPPELATGIKVSRAYDVWSLGCTFLEFLTWLCLGKEGLMEFSKNRLVAVNGWEDDYYYTDNGGQREDPSSTKVRPSVTAWIATLRGSDRCSRCLLEVLDLIQHQMIVIEVGSRVSAADLEEMLEDILQRAAMDTDFLLGEQCS